MISRSEPFWLLLPGLLVLVLAFFWPVGELLVTSFQAAPKEGVPGPTGFSNYVKFFADSYYLGVAERTFRLSAIITFFTFLLGFPLAYIMARAGPRLRFWLIVLTVVPLMTSVVVRTFGWLVILGRGGLLSKVLEWLGLTSAPIGLMHTETGIVVAMVQVLLPFMTLTIMGVIAGIDPKVEEAARTMGAGFFGVMRTVIVPLSLPGIVAGSLLTFALSISSFITPTLVGGVRLPMMAGGIFSHITGSLDWNFAAAMSMLLLLATLAVIVPYAMLLKRRST